MAAGALSQPSIFQHAVAHKREVRKGHIVRAKFTSLQCNWMHDISRSSFQVFRATLADRSYEPNYSPDYEPAADEEYDAEPSGADNYDTVCNVCSGKDTNWKSDHEHLKAALNRRVRKLGPPQAFRATMSDSS